ARVAESMSYAPARIGRVAHHGHPLQAGAPANLVLYDPRATRTVQACDTASLSRNNPYTGMTLPGRVVATFLRGTATVLDGPLQEVPDCRRPSLCWATAAHWRGFRSRRRAR